MNLTRSALFPLILSALFISLTLASALPILATSQQDNALEEIQNAEQQFHEAFTAIREAEAAGAEGNQIANLIERLNIALNLIEQANSTNTNETASQAAYISNQLKDEANQLRESALTSSLYTKIFVFGMVPVAALIVTLCVHYGLKRWRQSEVERVMKMEIRKK